MSVSILFSRLQEGISPRYTSVASPRPIAVDVLDGCPVCAELCAHPHSELRLVKRVPLEDLALLAFKVPKTDPSGKSSQSEWFVAARCRLNTLSMIEHGLFLCVSVESLLKFSTLVAMSPSLRSDASSATPARCRVPSFFSESTLAIYWAGEHASLFLFCTSSSFPEEEFPSFIGRVAFGIPLWRPRIHGQASSGWFLGELRRSDFLALGDNAARVTH